MPSKNELWRMALAGLIVTSLTPEKPNITIPRVPPIVWLKEQSSNQEAAEAQTTFEQLMAPFVVEAQRRREYWLAKDPEYSKRVDQELNEGRVNFLLFGQGETYEPPVEHSDIIGSHTILSYDTKRKTLDLVSITHDTLAPEIERYLKERGESFVFPTKIHFAYNLGGFALQRLVLENASGLSVDFQIAFWDEDIVQLVNTVFGKIKVNTPKTFRVNPIAYKFKLYPEAEFPEGIWELNGLQVVQFIKGIVIEADPQRPDPELEHNIRKALVFKAMASHWQELGNPLNKALFLGKMAIFLNTATRRGTVAYDFDSTSLLLKNIGNVAGSLKSLLFGGSEQSPEPQIEKTVYVVDRKHGDGGVRWISPEEFRRGNYADKNMEIPVGGDPYALDLVTGYWPSVRDLVKKILYTPPAPEVLSDQPSS